MNKIERLELYKSAIAQWGKYAQMDMMLEESTELILACGELIHSMMKLSRAKGEKKINMATMQICNEIADLEIMLEQAHLIFDDNLINEIKEKKLERLRKTIDT